MISHLTWTLLLTLLLTGATAMTGDRTRRERAYAAAYTFLSCTFFVVAGGGVMYWIHG
jgi:hypothetical protein